MAADSCWSCSEVIGARHKYCGKCGAPVSAFESKPGEGFLSRESARYVTAILDDSIGYPSDSNMDGDLQESLQSQLKEDIRGAFIHLAAVLGADDDLLLKGVDTAPFKKSIEGEEVGIEDLPPSFLGLFRTMYKLTEVFPPEFFEVFRGHDENTVEH